MMEMEEDSIRLGDPIEALLALYRQPPMDKSDATRERKTTARANLFRLAHAKIQSGERADDPSQKRALHRG